MSDSLFLTDVELRQMTGRARKSQQIAWLRQNGVPFKVSATGHPVVVRAALTGREEPKQEPTAPRWTPRVIGA